jgi:nucleoside-diphosphate-sugar epimerase
LDNLVDLLITCLHHPNAANQTFLVSDGEDLSTADLLVRLGDAVGRPARLFYVPEGVLKWGAGLLGQQALYQRVCGSLQVDIRLTQTRLGWSAPVSVDEGLRRAAAGLDR